MYFPLTDSIKSELKSFGITDDVIDFLSLQLSADNRYVVYPLQYPPRVVEDVVVYDTVWRGRKIPSVLKAELAKSSKAQRFFNPDEKTLPDGKMPLFYTPSYKFLHESVSKNNGILYLFEGDKDVWTALTAGIYNSAGILSAGSHVDPEIAYQFKTLGVRHVKYYPDNDKAGVTLARKLTEAFEYANVSIDVHSVPLHYNNHDCKDTSDLWLACECNSDVFVKVLQESEIWKLPTNTHLEYSANTDYFKFDLYKIIEEKLGATDYTPDGWSKYPVADPCAEHEHDDVRPAFFWNKNKHFGYCFKCATTYLAKDVAEGLGLNWHDFRYVDAEDKAVPSIKTTESQINASKAQSVIDASALLGDDFSAQLDYQESLYDQLADCDVMETIDGAISQFENRFSGAVLPEYPPIPNPIKKINYLGGNAKIIARPSMVGIVGSSGGFKTSFLNSVVVELLKNGFNGIIYSPEWSSLVQVQRLVQYEGGAKMTQFNLQDRFHYEKYLIESGEMSTNSPHQFGQDLSDFDKARTMMALDEIKSYDGKLYFAPSFSPDVVNILAQFRTIEKRMKRDGYPPDFVVIDYAQMIDIPSDRRGWTIKQVIRKIKQETNRRGWVTFVSSQSTKEATRAMREGKMLDSTAALDMRDDEFNLYLTLSPVDESTLRNVYDKLTGQTVQRRCLEVLLGVVKNSQGKSEKSEERAPRLLFDLDRLALINED
jgi:hypothetical protein